MERLILVDGSSMIFRAYYAIPGHLRTKSGLHTNAIYGFTNMFTKLLGGKTPDYGAVVFDPPGGSFRSQEYSEYKAQRPKMADDLAEQLPWIDKVVEVHNFPQLRVKGFEADDVIGTLTRQAVAKGMEVHIISADKDFAQLISDKVRMVDTLRDVSYDPELVRKKWGVKPEMFIDYLALIGDKVDNIPGVPGIGPKSAKTLLEKFGDVEGVLANLDSLKGKQKENLENHREDALLSKRLATIDQQVELPLTLDDLKYKEPSKDARNELYKELEFYSLLEGGAQDAAAMEAAGDVDYQLLEDPTEFLQSDLLTAVLPVYDGVSPVTGRWLGVAFCREAGTAYYTPLEKAEGVILDYLEDATKPKVAHDAKRLMVLCRRRGRLFQGVAGDTRLAAFLIDPTKTIPHDLSRVTKEYLQRVLRPTKNLLGGGKKRKQFSEIPQADLCDFAAHLVDAVRQLWDAVKDRVENPKLLEDELKLSVLLSKMEFSGVRVHPEELKSLGVEFRERLNGLEADIYEMAGREFNIGSPKQLGTVLFDEMGLPVIKKTKTGYSTNAEVLERLKPKHEIADRLLRYRKLEKLINTYTDVLQRELNETTGRIHCTFQQTVGATGRLISTEPDLQRTPVKTPEGKRIRQAFVPQEGWELLVADWSQIELRVLAHFSDDPVLVDAFQNDKDIHSRTAAELFHCTEDEVTKPQREIAKTVNFATIYGQGATALGQILGVPRKEAKAYIERYFEVYSGVRRWLDDTIEKALVEGSVDTLAGRHRHIPELFSKNFMDRTAGERIAANTPIQGSAADICKATMLAIDEAMQGMQARMLLQIHDELIFECPPEETTKLVNLVGQQMETAVPLKVPLKVEIGVGTSWEAAKS